MQEHPPKKSDGAGDPKRDAGDPQARAQETPGARCTRSPCAKCSKHTVVTTGHRNTRHFLRNGFTAYAALSRATNSSCHPRRRIKVQRNPVGLVNLRRLDTSNGCQDHTVLPYAATFTDPRVSHVLPTAFSEGIEAPFVHAPGECSRAFAQWKARPAIPRTRRRCRVHRIPHPRS